MSLIIIQRDKTTADLVLNLQHFFLKKSLLLQETKKALFILDNPHEISRFICRKLKSLQNFMPAATIVILYVYDHQKQENVHGTKISDFNMRVHFDHSKFIQHYKYELFGEKVFKHEPGYHCHSSTG